MSTIAGMRLRGILAVTVLLLLAAGCGADEESAASEPGVSTTVAGPDLSGVEFVDETGADSVEVDAVDNEFKAEYVEVEAGTTITFRNDGRNQHNIVPVVDGEIPEVPTDAFEPGTETAITFGEVGDVSYYCTLHGTPTKGMVGTVRVVEPGADG